MAILLLPSCTDGVVYDEYKHTSISGWEKNDTLSFITSKMQHGGEYEMDLGLRVNSEYPFTDIRLIVEQTVYPSNKLHADTLDCVLTDKRGNFTGQGVSYFQYTFPVSKLSLLRGDSVHIVVRHDMKREILPGISDIGIKVSLK